VSISSPLGEFVTQRFSELWSCGKPLATFMRMRVTLLGPSGGGGRYFESAYVDRDERRYLVDSHLLAHLARRRASILAYCEDNAALMYEVTVVEDDDHHLTARLAEWFREKYGQQYEVFICLRRLQDPSELVADLGDGGAQRPDRPVATDRETGH
jgi:hypothetical protein